MMAAITAASNGVRVLLLEKKDRVGKKLLSTGNGRCNMTNIQQEPCFYRSDQPDIPWKILRQFTAQDTIAFFSRLGIYTKNRNGYIYPNSDQASSVLDVLRMELKRLSVDVLTDRECTRIVRGKRGFRLLTGQGELQADRVILCAGSKAAPGTGSDGSGYALAKHLGHRIVPVLPALVQLRCEGDFFSAISGVRANGTVSLFSDGQWLASDTGEIQLTSYGISGIPVFQVSRFASRALYEKKNVDAVLDFMPDFSLEQLASFLKSRAQLRPEKRAGEFLIGLFHKKLSDLWVKQARIPAKKQAGELNDHEIHALTKRIKEFRVKVTAPNSFEQAQVCCGGVDLSQVDPETLESKEIKGLFFAGEVLDVDGCCGGYNLQWAWSSGYVAGVHSSGGKQ